MKIKLALLVVPVCLLFATSVVAHSGGTDADGCHTNSKTGDYHCHKPKPKKPHVHVEQGQKDQVKVAKI